MRAKNNYNATITACCIAYVIQALVVNFPPLLFIEFQNNYGASVSELGSLVAVTFIIQIAVDFFSPGYVRAIGQKRCVIFAHIMAAIGLVLLGALPELMPKPMLGVWIACFFYSFSSGLIEVLISPMVEACPTDNKESIMAFLHSFYCWGSAGIVIISIAFFALFGIENWNVMAIIWALVPALNAVFFCFVPEPPADEAEEHGGILHLLRDKAVWVFVLMMIASGAAELSMSQWASAFAESGLGVSKTMGDIAGPFMFAVLMGTGRVVYAALVKKVNLLKYLLGCSVLCVAAYLLVALSQKPVFSLIGCGIVGFAVGAFWPGTLSFASARMPGASTALFALLAFSGDIGCSTGPAVVAYVSDVFGNNLSAGLLTGAAFPMLLVVVSAVMIKKGKKDVKPKKS